MGARPVGSVMSEATALAYYDAIDAGDYEALSDLLAPGAVHDRPDRTIEGRETLVAFMREGRPNRDTSHEVVSVLTAVEDDGGDQGRGDRDADAVAVEGRLFDAGGDPMFGFVDVFSFDDGRIAEIRTYTR